MVVVVVGRDPAAVLGVVPATARLCSWATGKSREIDNENNSDTQHRSLVKRNIVGRQWACEVCSIR